MSDTGRGYFDSLGQDWDRLRVGFFPDAVRDRVLAVAGIERGRTAVDVGAGTGFITSGLVAHGLRVIAIDQSAVMLDVLRRKLPDSVALDCRLGDAEQIPVDDAQADYCFANMLLHHVENPARAIREMARIVRPGGHVAVTDLDAHTHTFLEREHHDRWMGFERADVRTWLQEAGLAHVDVEGIGERCRAESCEREVASVNIFLATGTVPVSR